MPQEGFSALISGVTYPFRAFGLLRRHRQLWSYVLIPILLNIVVGLLLYAGLYAWGAHYIGQISDESGFWLSAFEWLVRLLFQIALFLGLGWLLVRFGVVLGAPWYGQLSEQLEQIMTGHAPKAIPLTARSIAYDIWRALQYELKKLLLVIIILLPSLLLNFIPVAGTVLATIVGLALGGMIACLDFFDSTLERRRLSFRQKLGLVRKALPASAGFGLLAAFLVSIPFVNFFAIPLCVTAGTMLVFERRLVER